MSEQWMTFGEWMDNEARRLNHTQKSIANHAGVSVQYISDIKQGRRPPSRRIVDAVANLFDADRDLLYIMCDYCPPSLRNAPMEKIKQVMDVVR